MAHIPNIIIFADGGEEGGGSGARKLLEMIKSGQLNANVVKIVSGYQHGGVEKLAKEYGIEFEYIQFPKRVAEILNGSLTGRKIFTPEIIEEIRALYEGIKCSVSWDYIFCSGWIRYILELPVEKTINIHPGPTQGIFGGVGMFGDAVFQKQWEMYQDKKIPFGSVTIHYVNDTIDGGPIICQIPVDLTDCTSVDDVKEKINKGTEHKYQWIITRLITEERIKLIDGEVFWDIEITPKYMKDTFGVEWKTEWQGPLPEFEKFRN